MDSLASSNGANSRNSCHGSRCRRLFNIVTWILIEIFAMLSLFASIVVLSSSRHDKPHALVVWVIGYASGCVATIPLLCCRFLNRNHGTEQDFTQTHQDTSHNSPPTEPSPFVNVSVSQRTDEEGRQTTVSSTRSSRWVVELFSLALQLFFSVWMLFGLFWAFKVDPISAEGSNLYSFCVIFLWICCLGYGFVYVAHGIIGCCLPRSQENLNHTRGAATETVIGLPTYNLKLKDRDGEEQVTNSGGVGKSAENLEPKKSVSSQGRMQ